MVGEDINPHTVQYVGSTCAARVAAIRGMLLCVGPRSASGVSVVLIY